MDICWLLPGTKVPELVVSLVALSVLIVVKEVNARFRQKLLLPIPIELLVVRVSLFTLQVCSFNSPAGGILTTVIILD